MTRILVTGGCGFIGSAFIRAAMKDPSTSILNVDKMTYAASPESTVEFIDEQRYSFDLIDICGQAELLARLTHFRPDRVVHFAAESHVDRSIDQPADFIRSNVLGTFSLVECAQRYWENLDENRRSTFRLLHVSTDEVFGSLAPESPPLTERAAYAPSSPYAASKAGADHIVRAWQKTYGLPAIVANLSNNYGPFQFPEKFIPVVITAALTGETIPVYGDGMQIRDWLYVGDSVAGLIAAMDAGQSGATYLFSSGVETRNIDVVNTLCAIIDECRPASPYRPHRDLIAHVADRPGHDRRYSLNAETTRAALQWSPARTLEQGLSLTIRWYLENQAWWQRRRIGRDGPRIGVGRSRQV